MTNTCYMAWLCPCETPKTARPKKLGLAPGVPAPHQKLTTSETVIQRLANIGGLEGPVNAITFTPSENSGVVNLTEGFMPIGQKWQINLQSGQMKDSKGNDLNCLPDGKRVCITKSGKEVPMPKSVASAIQRIQTTQPNAKPQQETKTTKPAFTQNIRLPIQK